MASIPQSKIPSLTSSPVLLSFSPASLHSSPSSDSSFSSSLATISISSESLSSAASNPSSAATDGPSNIHTHTLIDHNQITNSNNNSNHSSDSNSPIGMSHHEDHEKEAPIAHSPLSNGKVFPLNNDSNPSDSHRLPHHRHSERSALDPIHTPSDLKNEKNEKEWHQHGEKQQDGHQDQEPEQDLSRDIQNGKAEDHRDPDLQGTPNEASDPCEKLPKRESDLSSLESNENASTASTERSEKLPESRDDSEIDDEEEEKQQIGQQPRDNDREHTFFVISLLVWPSDQFL